MLFIKRVILFFVALAIIISAIAISGLNTAQTPLDLYFFQIQLSLGFLLILSLFTGLLIGLFMSLFQFYLPLKSKYRKSERKFRQLNQEFLAIQRTEQNKIEHKLEHIND